MSDNGSSSDWIYILLTLVVSGLSLLKSQSAKKRSLNRPVSEEPEIFGDISLEEEETSVREAVSYERSENLRPYSDAVFFSEIPDDSFRENETETEREEEEETADFDLKKAIISSEILNRKFD